MIVVCGFYVCFAQSCSSGQHQLPPRPVGRTGHLAVGVSRKLSDGTTFTPPNVMGVGSWIKGYRNLNLFWTGPGVERFRSLWFRNISSRPLSTPRRSCTPYSTIPPPVSSGSQSLSSDQERAGQEPAAALNSSFLSIGPRSLLTGTP